MEIELRASLSNAKVDLTRLDQALLNLAINSNKSMPKGGSLKIRSGRHSIVEHTRGTIGAVSPGEYVTIEIIDTGTGISPTDITQIFRPFFSSKRSTGNTGLGLLTVRDFVLDAKGMLLVESRLNHGTTMIMYLPCALSSDYEALAVKYGKASALTAVSSTISKKTSEGTILLVEDDPSLCNSTKRLLQLKGWKVVSANSAKDALSQAAEIVLVDYVRPLILVTDVLLPDIKGVALARAVRHLLDIPDLPVLITSGLPCGAIARELSSLEENACFLSKPYGFDELGTALAELKLNYLSQLLFESARR